MAKTLVIYYSRKGQNYVNGSIVDLPKGNTEIVAVFTQLEALDFTWKKVFPIMTHEGSDIAGAPAALKKYCHGAVVGEGLAIQGAVAAGSEVKVAVWAKKNLA